MAHASPGIEFALKLNMYAQPATTGFDGFLRLAEVAEDLAFAGVYTIDHLLLPHSTWVAFSDVADPQRPYFTEAWTALAAIAARTRRVMVGPQVTPISLRHPVFIAKMAATIDHISNGRLVLQVGTGWHKDEYEAYGFDFDEAFGVRYQKMIEGLEVIERLWTDQQPSNYQGTYYQLKAAPFWPKPVQKPRPPIWFGGTGQKVREAVARFGDAWTPAAPHYTGLRPAFYKEGLEQIRGRMLELGRDPASLTPAALFFMVIAEDRDEAYREADKLRRRNDWKDLTLDQVQDLGVAIIGNPDDCIRGLQRYVDVGVRHFTLGFAPISTAEVTEARMRLFAREVMPHFHGVAVSAGAAE